MAKMINIEAEEKKAMNALKDYPNDLNQALEFSKHIWNNPELSREQIKLIAFHLINMD